MSTNPNVHYCDKCEAECGGGIADLGDNACSVCGQHDAPHVYVPASRITELEEENERLRGAVAWACGEGDSDFFSEAEREERGLPRYWWRARLRAALSPDSAEGSEDG